MVMHDDDNAASLIAGLRQGDTGAIHGLWALYFPKLLRKARAQLASFPLRSFDEEDVALSVFDSLQRGARAGRFENLEDHSSLWALLVALTQKKAAERVRREGCKRRGGGGVRGDSVFGFRFKDGAGFERVADDEPAVELLACLEDEFRRLTSLLRDDVLRRVASLRLEGYTNEEIAGRLAITQRAVQRKLQLVEKRWTQELQR